MAWRYVVLLNVRCASNREQHATEDGGLQRERIFYASKVAAEMGRDIHNAARVKAGHPLLKFRIAKRFQELPKYTGPVDGWGRPINPANWSDEDISLFRIREVETRRFHGERCRYAKKMNGRTKVDH